MLPHTDLINLKAPSLQNAKTFQELIHFVVTCLDNKSAICNLCQRKMERGIELTAKMKTPNLKHHLKTVHPEIFNKLQETKHENSFKYLKSARGER